MLHLQVPIRRSSAGLVDPLLEMLCGSTARSSPADLPQSRCFAMTRPTRERELRYFLLLDRSEQEAALRRLAAAGLGDYSIATASGLSVEQVRRILTESRSEGSL